MTLLETKKLFLSSTTIWTKSLNYNLQKSTVVIKTKNHSI